MKVLFLIDTLEVGGAEQSLLAIVSRFQQFEPVMCHLYPGEGLKAAYKAAGIRVISLNIVGKYGFFKAARAVRAVIQRELPQVVHATLFRADIVGRMACYWLPIPLISSLVNDSYSFERYRTLPLTRRMKLRGCQALDAYTAQLVTQFVSNSEAIRQSKAKTLGIPLKDISVIYRGRSPATFKGMPHEKRFILRKQLGCGPKTKCLLNVARLIESKGHEELLEAIVHVRDWFPDVRLLIAGEGPNRARLEQRIKELGLQDCVQLLGNRNDVPELLQAADMFIFPSHYEGLPGALVEAMFAGLPIVASDIPVHREVVTPDESGLLTPVRDPQELANAVRRMIEHPVEAATIGQAARETALVKFDIDQIVVQYESLYEQVIRGYSSK